MLSVLIYIFFPSLFWLEAKSVWLKWYMCFVFLVFFSIRKLFFLSRLNPFNSVGWENGTIKHDFSLTSYPNGKMFLVSSKEHCRDLFHFWWHMSIADQETCSSLGQDLEAIGIMSDLQDALNKYCCYCWYFYYYQIFVSEDHNNIL